MTDSRLLHHQQALEQLEAADIGYLGIAVKNGVAVAEAAAAWLRKRHRERRKPQYPPYWRRLTSSRIAGYLAML